MGQRKTFTSISTWEIQNNNVTVVLSWWTGLTNPWSWPLKLKLTWLSRQQGGADNTTWTTNVCHRHIWQSNENAPRHPNCSLEPQCLLTQTITMKTQMWNRYSCGWQILTNPILLVWILMPIPKWQLEICDSDLVCWVKAHDTQRVALLWVWFMKCVYSFTYEILFSVWTYK